MPLPSGKRTSTPMPVTNMNITPARVFACSSACYRGPDRDHKDWCPPPSPASEAARLLNVGTQALDEPQLSFSDESAAGAIFLAMD